MNFINVVESMWNFIFLGGKMEDGRWEWEDFNQ